MVKEEAGSKLEEQEQKKKENSKVCWSGRPNQKANTEGAKRKERDEFASS